MLTLLKLWRMHRRGWIVAALALSGCVAAPVKPESTVKLSSLCMIKPVGQTDSGIAVVALLCDERIGK